MYHLLLLLLGLIGYNWATLEVFLQQLFAIIQHSGVSDLTLLTNNSAHHPVGGYQREFEDKLGLIHHLHLLYDAPLSPLNLLLFAPLATLPLYIRL